MGSILALLLFPGKGAAEEGKPTVQIWPVAVWGKAGAGLPLGDIGAAGGGAEVDIPIWEDRLFLFVGAAYVSGFDGDYASGPSGSVSVCWDGTCPGGGSEAGENWSLGQGWLIVGVRSFWALDSQGVIGIVVAPALLLASTHFSGDPLAEPTNGGDESAETNQIRRDGLGLGGFLGVGLEVRVSQFRAAVEGIGVTATGPGAGGFLGWGGRFLLGVEL